MPIFAGRPLCIAPKHPGGPLQRSGKSADSWNEALGISLEAIPLLYLPINRTILRRYRFLRLNDETASINNLAEVIINEVIFIWNCARIPISVTRVIQQQVVKLIEWWNASGKKTADRMKPKFQKKLDELFDIAKKPKGRYNKEKAEEYLNNIMKSRGKQKTTGFEQSARDQDWTDDMQFYLDQKGPRLKQMGSSDEKLAQKEKKKEKMRVLQQSSSTTETQNEDSSTTTTTDEDNGTDVDLERHDDTYTPTSKKRCSEEYVTLKIPRDAMTQLSPLAYRLKLSTRQQTAFMAEVMKVGGANVKDVKLSVANTHRERHHGIDKKSLFIKEEFLANTPPRMVLHWDGKKITYEKKKKKDERLAIVGSFPGVDEGGVNKSDQFFAAPLVADGTGIVCSQTLVDTLSDWKIPESIIIGMSWDTTASNTGRIKGAATHFESR